MTTERVTMVPRIGNIDITGFDGHKFVQLCCRYKKDVKIDIFQ